MRLDIEQLKQLAESGDKTALESYIYKAMDRSDVAAVLNVNTEVKSEIDAEKDRHHSKALKTWQDNNLDRLVEDEVKKRNPEKSPAELEVEKLRKEIEDERKARSRQEVSNKAIKLANEKGLPVDLVDYFLADDEENTVANLTKFEDVFKTSVQAGVEANFKKHGRDVGQGTSDKDSAAATFAKTANEQSKPQEKTIWD